MGTLPSAVSTDFLLEYVSIMTSVKSTLTPPTFGLWLLPLNALASVGNSRCRWMLERTLFLMLNQYSNDALASSS